MTERGHGMYWGVVTNLILAAVLSSGPWDDVEAGVWLIAFGAGSEVLGVLFVASPELLPRAERLSRRGLDWLERQRLRFVGALKRPLRLSGHVRAIAVGGGITAGGSLSGEVIRGKPQGDLEQQAWLVDRVLEQQERLQDLSDQVTRMPDRWRAEMDVVRQELEGLQRELVRSVADARIRLRLIGLGYVLLGLGLSLVGNLLTLA